MHVNKILRCILPVAVGLLVLTACSKERVVLPRYEYDATLAEAYYFGADAQKGVDLFRLDLAQGRLDEDSMELLSAGAVMLLQISAPVEDNTTLPAGTYHGSAEGDQAYTYTYGQLLDGDVIVGSSVGIRAEGAKQTQFYPVEKGRLTVSVSDKSGLYEVRIEAEAAGKTFTFAYRGEITTVDCSNVSGKNFAYNPGMFWFRQH